MTSREPLGAADVSDAELTAMVADLLHEDASDVELVDTRVEPVDYDLPAITTGGRWWVSGEAAVRGERSQFRMFVKQVQSWERHPFFASVPEEFRELAASGVPWKTEAEVYRSDLASRLPEGLSAPRTLGVFDLDATSSAIWLEEVPVRPATWDRARYERAAYLLGRLAGSPDLAPLAGLRDVEWSLETYVTGRVTVQVAPILMSDEVWQHPLCAGFDADLRDRLRAVVADVTALAAEGDALPRLLSHGDACPNNLLAGERDDELVMIDFGFWGAAPVGFDLTQLLVGDVQIGKRRAGNLAELDEASLAAYVAGLRAEGCEIPEHQVRRGHALCLLVMTGLSTIPFDLFEGPVDDRTKQVAADRAAIARYALELLEATSTRAGSRSSSM
ncbi:phosphotransferase [Nocardioides halotolerans]|uniref:phosphotransferase n=1 Tax=Nocardioides halotolerans TaxID=433660 RepID=UPI00048C7EDB|nr:phosphotransferase [Nocardioides halotolerans]